MIIVRCFSLVLFLLLAGCFSPDSVTRNIRVTAQAEVDGKIIEGSAVMGLRWKAGSNGRMYVQRNSEAIILELGDVGTIYILDSFIGKSGNNNTSYWPFYVASALGINRTVSLEDFSLINSAQGKFSISAEVSRMNTLPLMVSFMDESRRETMFEVKPSNFSHKFGPNVSFKGLWFEFTDDQPTDVIQQKLPLMFQAKNNASYTKKYSLRDGNGKLIPISEKDLPQKVGKSSFKERSF